MLNFPKALTAESQALGGAPPPTPSNWNPGSALIYLHSPNTWAAQTSLDNLIPLGIWNIKSQNTSNLWVGSKTPDDLPRLRPRPTQSWWWTCARRRWSSCTTLGPRPPWVGTWLTRQRRSGRRSRRWTASRSTARAPRADHSEASTPPCQTVPLQPHLVILR